LDNQLVEADDNDGGNNQDYYYRQHCFDRRSEFTLQCVC
jgi:hypothetical protein